MPADPYISQDDLLADIPLATFTDACDDDKDGVADEDVVAALIAGGCADVDEYLAARYTTPLTADLFDPEGLPALVTSAAKLFTLRRIFQRRGLTGDNFPFRDALAERIAALKAVRDGKANLPNLTEGNEGVSPGAAVTEAMATEGSAL